MISHELRPGAAVEPGADEIHERSLPPSGPFIRSPDESHHRAGVAALRVNPLRGGPRRWECGSESIGSAAALGLGEGRHPHDPRLTELVGELSVHDEDLRQWWADRDVLEYTHGTKRYHHPLVGEPVLDHESLILPDGPDQAPLPLHRRARQPLRARAAPAGQLVGSGPHGRRGHCAPR
ncbi:hypothetical protein ACFC1R_38310 [Kitasatospora sp. NPDC056138]|uniref:MmyB family transcriptional regulator n=1 Tax=Kitasatospora sp. NPDC056138 TaxID=3345724 RepID=UPI0035DC83D5